jgi:hypothetical protein
MPRIYDIDGGAFVFGAATAGALVGAVFDGATGHALCGRFHGTARSPTRLGASFT